MSLADAARRIEAAGFERVDLRLRGPRHAFRPGRSWPGRGRAPATRTIELGTGVFRCRCAIPSAGPAGPHHPPRIRGAAPLRGGRGVYGSRFRRARSRFRLALPSPQRISRHHGPPLEGGERGRRVPRPHLARAAGQTARAHRLMGRLEVDRARGPRVRRLDRVRARKAGRLRGIALSRSRGGAPSSPT